MLGTYATIWDLRRTRRTCSTLGAHTCTRPHVRSIYINITIKPTWRLVFYLHTSLVVFAETSSRRVHTTYRTYYNIYAFSPYTQYIIYCKRTHDDADTSCTSLAGFDTIWRFLKNKGPLRTSVFALLWNILVRHKNTWISILYVDADERFPPARPSRLTPNSPRIMKRPLPMCVVREIRE